MQVETAQPFGKYLLLEQVAVGGMAEIFRAKTVGADGFEKEVAIKRILPSYSEDDGFVTMFKDEAKIAAQLDHANIVKVFDFDEVAGDYYIAMEYVRGRDLKRLVEIAQKHHKRFTTTQILFVILETAKALDYAHKRTSPDGSPLNIVHRDVTPHNVMITFDGQVKLMDFGIAKAASRATKTRAGTVKGKCAYMSPEQARGKPLDGRSDMFSLGIITWELLTGKRLFSGGSDFDVLSKVLKSEIPDPRQFDASIPDEVSRIVLRVLDRDRDRRYADCGELLQDLNRYFYSQCDDAHNHKLGLYAAALSEESGHTPAELPTYQATASAASQHQEAVAEERTQLLSIEDVESQLGSGSNTPQSDFDAVQDSAKTMPLDSSMVSNFLQQQNLMPGQQQQQQQQQHAAPGYPSAPQHPGMQPNPYGAQMPGHPQGMMPPGVPGQPYMPMASYAQMQVHPSMAHMMAYGQAGPPKGNTGLIIAIIVVLFLILGGGGAAWYFISQSKAGNKADAEATTTEATTIASDAPESRVNIKTIPPGAQVSINGEPQPNPTPVFAFEGKIGDKLTIEFTKEGYETLSIDRRLIQQSQTIEVELVAVEEVAAEGPVADANPNTVANPQGDGDPAQTPGAAAEEFGSLLFETVPAGSTIKIDGESVDGTTPLTVDHVKVGSKLKIVAIPESKEMRQASKTITVESTGETKVELRHRERKEREEDDKGSSGGDNGAPASLSVNAIPWGQVYLDGKRLGTTPVKTEVPGGKYKLEISFPAKKMVAKKSIKLKGGGKESFTYDFNADKWR